MGLLQETCDAIHSRSKEIEQHIIKNWNDASDSKQYGRLVNMDDLPNHIYTLLLWLFFAFAGLL